MTDSTPHIVSIKEFEKSTYNFRSDGVVEIHQKNDSCTELEDAIKEFEFLSGMTDYLPMVAIVYPGQNTSISSEVRE